MYDEGERGSFKMCASCKKTHTHARCMQHCRNYMRVHIRLCRTRAHTHTHRVRLTQASACARVLLCMSHKACNYGSHACVRACASICGSFIRHLSPAIISDVYTRLLQSTVYACVCVGAMFVRVRVHDRGRRYAAARYTKWRLCGSRDRRS